MNPDRDAKTRTDETSGSGMYGDDFENQPLSGTPVSRLGKSQVGQGATYKFREGEWILFPVSIAKFVTMFVFTFGLYSIYWAYKQFDWFKKNGDLVLYFPAHHNVCNMQTAERRLGSSRSRTTAASRTVRHFILLLQHGGSPARSMGMVGSS